MKQSDHNDFIKATEKEVDAHECGNNWEMFKIHEIPKGMKSIIAIW